MVRQNSGSVYTNKYTTAMKVQVLKNNGSYEPVSFDKILKRIGTLCEKLSLDRIDIVEVAKDTISGLFNGISTEEIDHLTAVYCAEKIRDDPQYDTLAAGICVSRLHKITHDDFMTVTELLFNNKDDQGKINSLVTEEYYNFVKDNIKIIQENINYEFDYDFDYFGYKTLERAYLHRSRHNLNINNNINDKNDKISKEKELKNKKGSIIERPQHLWMRVAVALNQHDIAEAMETYYYLSRRMFIFGSPTLYNAGSKRNQMSSCFLLQMGDSIEQIYDTIKDVALISKTAGGVGLNCTNVRASGSVIRGTNGVSNGPIPFIQELNWTGRAVNQGGRRNGAIAVYMEVWHGDIYHFTELRSNTGQEDSRARDIFLALFIPDIFMRRVRDNKIWSLMCPDECPGLTTSYGEEFEALYEKYESEKKYKRQVQATDLWFHIMTNQASVGQPYMLYKDHINRKTNHQNLGVIQTSNLCSEILQYSSVDEISVCNLASLCLPRFVKYNDDNEPEFDFELLIKVSKIAIRNLNRVIDINYYPVEKAKNSNMKHRPTGLGVSGLSNAYFMFDMPFDSEQARILNRKIFESIYYGAITESIELAKIHGPYPSFLLNGGSPYSRGILQHDMWGLKEKDLLMGFNWDEVRENLKVYGARNSLLTTIMPTQSGSQLCGVNESIEPITTNIYTRSTLAGEYTVVCKELVNKLIELNLWNKNIRDELIYDKGSIKNIQEIPDYIKEIYKTAYEIKNKPIIQQAIERGPFIEQSQSLNLFMLTPNFDSLTNAHFYGWSNGLKGSLYYLKGQVATHAIAFGLDAEIINNIKKKRKSNDKTEKNENYLVTINAPCGESCSA